MGWELLTGPPHPGQLKGPHSSSQLPRLPDQAPPAAGLAGRWILGGREGEGSGILWQKVDGPGPLVSTVTASLAAGHTPVRLVIAHHPPPPSCSFSWVWHSVLSQSVARSLGHPKAATFSGGFCL